MRTELTNQNMNSREIGFKNSDFGCRNFPKYGGAEYEKQKSLLPIRSTNSLLTGTVDGPKSFQAKDNSYYYYDLEIRFQIVFCIVFATI